MTGPYVPIEELANHFSVSISTIRAWVRQGSIPKDTYIKVGNTYRFCIGEVTQALTAQAEAAKATVTPIGVETVSATQDEPINVNLDDDY